MAQSLRRAYRIARLAAKRSSAYRALLAQLSLNPKQLVAGAPNAVPFDALPVLDKDNTFGRFDLAELAGRTNLRDVADVLTSSGRGGRVFGYRLTGRRTHDRSWFDIDLGLQDAFGVDQRPALLVNCLPMGVVFRSRAVAVANVSVREDMACAILRDVGRSFAQTIVCCDPLFVNRLLDQAVLAGVDWKQLQTSLVIGEEVLVESQRQYIAARMGIDVDRDPHRLVASSFGVGELGLNLLFETRETIAIRRVMRASASVWQATGLGAQPVSPPAVFCYNPMRSHIEVLDADPSGFGELCITMLDEQAPIALPRYRTGDLARLLTEAETASLARLSGRGKPWLPVIMVKGRIADRVAGLPEVESVKELVYCHPELAGELTGAFKIQRVDAHSAQVTLQLKSGGNLARAQHAAAEAERLAGDGLPANCRLVVTDSRLGWGPALDYERKFAYLGQDLRSAILEPAG